MGRGRRRGAPRPARLGARAGYDQGGDAAARWTAGRTMVVRAVAHQPNTEAASRPTGDLLTRWRLSGLEARSATKQMPAPAWTQLCDDNYFWVSTTTNSARSLTASISSWYTIAVNGGGEPDLKTNLERERGVQAL